MKLPRSSRLPALLLTILAIASALGTLVFVGQAFLFSPQNPVAAEIGFEALRVARHLPLYVDPWVGAWEDGAPPARYYVLYTPIFPWIVGTLSPASLGDIRVVGRIIAVTGWLAVHIAPVVFARRERRRETALAAMVAAGIYFIARHAASMSPDTLATALVCVGVARAAKSERIDPLSAILIVSAPFVKPSCIGGVVGVALVHLALRRPGWIWTTIVTAATALGFAACCHVASDGQWLSNMSRSTGQPLTFARWVQELGSRVILLGAPHVFVAWLAWRRKVTWLVVGPLLGSIAWATFIMAKHGSGSHYWLEPTGLSLIAIARMPVRVLGDSDSAGEEPRFEPRWLTRALPWASVAFAALVLAVSVPLFLREPARYRHHDAVVRAVDAHCVRQPGQFVVSSDLGLELALNGRFSVPSWQTGFLARSGRFPVDAWRADIARPEVRWVVLAIDPRAAPGTSNDERVELSPFYDVLAGTLFDHFAFDQVVAGQFVFRRK